MVAHPRARDLQSWRRDDDHERRDPEVEPAPRRVSRLIPCASGSVWLTDRSANQVAPEGPSAVCPLVPRVLYEAGRLGRPPPAHRGQRANRDSGREQPKRQVRDWGDGTGVVRAQDQESEDQE